MVPGRKQKGGGAKGQQALARPQDSPPPLTPNLVQRGYEERAHGDEGPEVRLKGGCSPEVAAGDPGERLEGAEDDREGTGLHELEVCL